MHILSPSAGKICHRFAVSMKCGLTKEKLNSCAGNHLTMAEELTVLDAIKGVGSAKKGGC